MTGHHKTLIYPFPWVYYYYMDINMGILVEFYAGHQLPTLFPWLDDEICRPFINREKRIRPK
jgi:hypothetical protein